VSGGPGNRQSASGRRGFTLLELTIVLVIAGLTLGFAGLTFSGYFERSSARRAAQVFARDLSLARSAAVRAKQPFVIRFYESSRWYQVVAQSSGTELVRRRFGVNADVDLSAIDLVFNGDTVVVNTRGVFDLSNIHGSGTLGEARFSAGASRYTVSFNSLGASKVEVR
jgi:prepilin-type N-terminal cleavage/methylation domain-containing protein